MALLCSSVLRIIADKKRLFALGKLGSGLHYNILSCCVAYREDRLLTHYLVNMRGRLLVGTDRPSVLPP